MSNQSRDEVKIKTRLTPAKSVMSAISTLVICIGLFFVLQNQFAGNKYVYQVKKGHPNNYPNITYEEAFGAYYSSPEWKYDGETEGAKIIKFTGSCQYNNQPVTVELRYQLKDNSFYLLDGKVGGTEVSILTLAALDNKPFEEYKQ